VRNIKVEDVNQGWSAAINQDGPYARGNAGTSDNFDDFNWHDSFWLAVIGNVKVTDIVRWATSWAPGSDGDLPPVVVQHTAQAGLPHRLELQARLGSKGSVSYSSGVMTVTLMVNEVALGDVLELTLEDDQTDSHAESATWRVVGPLVPPVSIHLSDSVTMLPVDNSAGVVWYDFVVPGTNPVVIDTVGGTADTEIAVYDSLGHLIAQDDSSGNDAFDSSLLTLTGLTPGATYYLAVGEYQMTFGTDNWQVTQPDGSTGEAVVLNANLSYVATPLAYAFENFAFASIQAPTGSATFRHTLTGSGAAAVVDLYGVADVVLETSSPGTTSTRLVPIYSRLLGGAIDGYEFWENGSMVSSAPWDPYDTTEQTVRPVAISEHLYNGHSPAANRFVRFILSPDWSIEMTTAFDGQLTAATFTGVWAGKAISRTPALVQTLELDKTFEVNPVVPVTNPFSITWDYSSSANGNIRTDTDLPPGYGTPTPGVSRYLLKNGMAVTASMTMQANAGPNTVLQPGDIVILQGVMHVGTLTGTEDSQTRNVGGGYSPLTHTVTEHPSYIGDENLQLLGEQGVDWASTRTQCSYPLGLDARTFTIKATPTIDPTTGACDFWYGPFFTLTQAEMFAFGNTSELISTINGIAIYRGGVSPANLIFSDVNREIFKMRSEVREDPAQALVQNFAATPLSGTAPLVVTYQDLSNFPTTDVSYTVTGLLVNATTDTIGMQGVYDVMQEVRRPDTTLSQVTKTAYLTVNERTYPSDAPYVDIFRDEYNGVVIDIASHVPNLAPVDAVVTGTNVFTTGNGYVHRQDTSQMYLRVDTARPTGTNFDYKLAWSMAFAEQVFTNGTLFFAHIFGNDYGGMNGGNPGYAAVRVFRQAGAVRLGLTLENLGGSNYAELTTTLPSTMGTIYECELVLTPAGATLNVNGETLNNVFDSSTWGDSLTAFQVTNVVNAIYLNRMRMAYKPVLSVVLQEDFNGAAGTFVPRAPTLPGTGWLTDHATPSATWPSMVLDGAGALVTPFVNGNSYNGGVTVAKQVDVVDPNNGDLSYGIPTQLSSIEFDISTGTAFRTGGTYMFAIYLRFAAADQGFEDYLSLSAYRDQTTGQATWEYQNDYGGNYDTQTLPLVFTANTDYLVVITKVGATLEIRVNGALIWTVPFVQGDQPLLSANLRQHSGKIRSLKVSGLG